MQGNSATPREDGHESAADVALTPHMSDNPYTLRISEYHRGHDLIEFVTGPDETVEVRAHVAHYDGKIGWSDNWARLTEISLTDLGLVGRKFHPGHGDPHAQYEEYFLL